MIEETALERGHEIVARIDIDTQNIPYSDMDVAIDFSTPEAAFDNIRSCLEAGIPVICGTTGWLKHYEQATELCRREGGAFLYASNFSLGVNVFFALNEFLARMMGELPEYETEIEEIHHIHKQDAPSGTAITLAEGILAHSAYKGWELDGGKNEKLPVHSRREGEVPGTHTVRYSSDIDSLEIRHTAHNRKGFALGAVVAAEWIVGKKGVFGMKDVLNLGKD